jgi:hypothetical protein
VQSKSKVNAVAQSGGFCIVYMVFSSLESSAGNGVQSKSKVDAVAQHGGFNDSQDFDLRTKLPQAGCSPLIRQAGYYKRSKRNRTCSQTIFFCVCVFGVVASMAHIRGDEVANTCTYAFPTPPNTHIQQHTHSP